VVLSAVAGRFPSASVAIGIVKTTADEHSVTVACLTV
jgi:hypothetical protein